MGIAVPLQCTSSAQAIPWYSWGCGWKRCAAEAWSRQLGALERCSVKGEYFPVHQQLWLLQLFSVRLLSKAFHQELSRESGVVGIMAVPHTIHPKTGGSPMRGGRFSWRKRAFEKVPNKSCAHFSSAAGLVLVPLALQRVT